MSTKLLYNHELWIRQLLQEKPYPLSLDQEEWELVMPLLKWHELESHVYHHWKDQLASPILELTHLSWSKNHDVNLAHLQNWKQLKHLAMTNEIPLIPLGGISLLESIYAYDPGQAQFQVLPLWVPESFFQSFFTLVKSDWGSLEKSNFVLQQQLFAHLPINPAWIHFDEPTKTYKLVPELQLLYLCQQYFNKSQSQKLSHLIHVLLYFDEWQTKLNYDFLLQQAHLTKTYHLFHRALYIGAFILESLTLRKLWKDLEFKVKVSERFLSWPKLVHRR